LPRRRLPGLPQGLQPADALRRPGDQRHAGLGARGVLAGGAVPVRSPSSRKLRQRGGRAPDLMREPPNDVQSAVLSKGKGRVQATRCFEEPGGDFMIRGNVQLSGNDLAKEREPREKTLTRPGAHHGREQISLPGQINQYKCAQTGISLLFWSP